MLVYCVLDINRLQPWFFQYMLILIVFIGVRRKSEMSIPLLQLIVAGMFFWGGIHKFNTFYFTETALWLSQALGKGNAVQYIFYILPAAEILIAISLIIKPIRKAGIIAGTLLQFFIIFILSPLGLNYNLIIIPWNLAVIVFTWVLFYKTENDFRDYLKMAKMPVFVLICTLVYLFPLLHIFNLWPAYMSFNLYSGNTSKGYIFVSEPVKELLPEEISNLVNNNRLDISAWSMKELNVPCFPEKTTFIQAAEFIRGYAREQDEVTLLYQPKSTIFSKKQAEFP
jgi:hypothetical protein